MTEPKRATTPPAPVRVVVVDDHPLYRDALAESVRRWPGLELAGTASDGEEAMELIRQERPDVAAVDVRMPGLDGIDVLAAVREEGLQTKVVLLSGQISYGDVARGVPGGATSFIDKTADRNAICSTFVAAGRGEGHFSPPVQRRLAAVLDPEQRPSSLTERERQILLLAAEGLSVQEISDRLSVSTSTVKTHLAHIYEKLGVHNKAAAVAIAVRTQVI